TELPVRVVAPAARLRPGRGGARALRSGGEPRRGRRRGHGDAGVPGSGVGARVGGNAGVGIGPAAHRHRSPGQARATVAAVPVGAAGHSAALVHTADQVAAAVAVELALHRRLVAAAEHPIVAAAVRPRRAVAVGDALVGAAPEVTDEALGAVARQLAIGFLRELTGAEAELVAHALETRTAVALRPALVTAATE